MKTVIFYVIFLFLIIFSVQMAVFLLDDVLKLETQTNPIWLLAILALGPGSVLAVIFSRSLYLGDDLRKKNWLTSGYTAGAGLISGILQFLINVFISKYTATKAKKNLPYSVFLGLGISLTEVMMVFLVIAIAGKIANVW